VPKRFGLIACLLLLPAWVYCDVSPGRQQYWHYSTTYYPAKPRVIYHSVTAQDLEFARTDRGDSWEAPIYAGPQYYVMPRGKSVPARRKPVRGD